MTKGIYTYVRGGRQISDKKVASSQISDNSWYLQISDRKWGSLHFSDTHRNVDSFQISAPRICQKTCLLKGSKGVELDFLQRA